MTIAPTTMRLKRLRDGVVIVLPKDDLEVVLTDAMASALWQTLGAAIEAKPMPALADDAVPASCGQGGGNG